jgi:hypothetical protein
MTDQMGWLRTRLRVGWALLFAGAAVFAGSLIAAAANPGSGFNFNIVGGLGIGVAGGGVGVLVRYGNAMRDREAALRVMVSERDERAVLIRVRAGNRAWWVSVLIVWLGLMWASFAANGQLPRLEGDVLWDFLAIAVVVPFAVYAASIVVEERRS